LRLLFILSAIVSMCTNETYRLEISFSSLWLLENLLFDNQGKLGKHSPALTIESPNIKTPEWTIAVPKRALDYVSATGSNTREERHLPTRLVVQVDQLTILGPKVFFVPLIGNDGGDAASEFGILPKVLKAWGEDHCRRRSRSFLEFNCVGGLFIDHDRVDSLLLRLYHRMFVLLTFIHNMQIMDPPGCVPVLSGS